MVLEEGLHSPALRPAIGEASPARVGPTFRSVPPFEDLLRFARLERGPPFHQLSERSRVDVAYLYRLEGGQASRPGRNVAIRIAIGLGFALEATDELLRAAGHLSLVREMGS